MTLPEAFHGTSQFWPGGQPFVFGHGATGARLAAEYSQPLPEELQGPVRLPFSQVQLSSQGLVKR